MENKTVFITGAVKNSGLAIAEKFAANGYQIALSSRDAAAAENAAALLHEKYGVKTKGYRLSLTDIAEIKAVFADVAETFGALDVYVGNSANLGVGQEILTIDEASFDAVMDVNFKGNFFCAQQAALIMKQRRHGAIVFIGSVHYRAAVWGRSLYAASKGAIASLVHNMAFELAEYGIRVNQLVPGAIRTDRWDGVSDAEAAKRRSNWPSGIESTGEDIANGVYFLASDEARTITGSDLTVDSGVLACLLSYNGGKH